MTLIKKNGLHHISLTTLEFSELNHLFILGQILMFSSHGNESVNRTLQELK